MSCHIEVQFVVMCLADTTAIWLVTYLGVVNCHIEVQFVELGNMAHHDFILFY